MIVNLTMKNRHLLITLAFVGGILLVAIVVKVTRATLPSARKEGRSEVTSLPIQINQLPSPLPPSPANHGQESGATGVSRAQELLHELWLLTENGKLGKHHPVVQSALAAIEGIPIADLFAACESLKDPGERKLSVEYAVEIASRIAPEKCIEFIKLQPAEQQVGLTRSALRQWMKLDPDAAASWLIANESKDGPLMGDGIARESLLHDAGYQLGRSNNSETALRLVADVTGEARRGALLRGLILAMPTWQLTSFGKDVLANRDLSESIRGASIYEIGKVLADEDIQSARNWAEGITTEEEPTLASTASVGLVWMRSAPIEAANWWTSRVRPEMLPSVYSDIVGLNLPRKVRHVRCGY